MLGLGANIQLQGSCQNADSMSSTFYLKKIATKNLFTMLAWTIQWFLWIEISILWKFSMEIENNLKHHGKCLHQQATNVD